MPRRPLGPEGRGDLAFAAARVVEPETRRPRLQRRTSSQVPRRRRRREITALCGPEAWLAVKRRLDFARKAYSRRAGGDGQNVFAISEELLQAAEVELCHPRSCAERASRTAVYPQQWHLAGAVIGGRRSRRTRTCRPLGAERGRRHGDRGIDDGVDIDHPESPPGKLVRAVRHDRGPPDRAPTTRGPASARPARGGGRRRRLGARVSAEGEADPIGWPRGWARWTRRRVLWT